MPKPYAPHVVTANHLLKGDVIYQTATGWTRLLDKAEVLTDEASAAARLAAAQAQQSSVVGAYLAQVETSEGLPRPVHFREEFRATGPSNYAHGKQVEHL